MSVSCTGNINSCRCRRCQGVRLNQFASTSILTSGNQFVLANNTLVDFTTLLNSIANSLPGSPYLSLSDLLVQTVLSDVIFEGTITAKEVILNPSSMLLGSNQQDQAGIYFTTTSGIDGTKAFLLTRPYDDTGSGPIIAEDLGIRGVIDILDLTGTRLTINDGLELTGASAPPGIEAYENEIRLFTYDEVKNLSIKTEIGSFGGTLVATVTDFNSGPIKFFNVTNITQSNPAVVTALGHNFVPGDRKAIADIIDGMTEINDKSAIVGAVTATTFELVGIDSTSFTPYVSGGRAGGLLLNIVFDNLLRISALQNYFTTFTVEESFEVDGGEIAPSVILPYTEVVGWDILEEQEVLTDAPKDGNLWGRRDGDWAIADGNGGLLTRAKFVDIGNTAANRDGAINNPYKEITEALADITDAAINKRYVLYVQPGTYANVTAKPFIYIIGNDKDTVVTGGLDIPDIAGDYYFESIVTGNSNTANMTTAAIVNYKKCLILASSLAFDLGGTSGTEMFYDDCKFNGKMDFRQVPAFFRYTTINDMEFLDFSLNTYPYEFDGCIFKGALTSSGSTVSNPFKFINSDWQSGSSISTPSWIFIVTADSSFPFEDGANISVVERKSSAKMVDYDNAVSSLESSQVNDAIDELATPSGGAYAMSGVAVVTPISAANTPAKVITGGADSGYNLEGFTHSDNRLTRSGATARYLAIVAISGNNASAGTNNGRMHLYKNGAVLTDEVTMDAAYNATDNSGITAAGLVSLSDTDFIEVFMENLDNDEDFETVDLNVTLIKWRV